MFFAVAVVDALGHVVEPPVEAINKKMYVDAVGKGMAHLALHAPCPQVAGVLSTLAAVFPPVLPGIAEEGAQDEGVEALCSVRAEERIVELGRAVFALELQTERVLGILLGQSSVTTMQGDGTVDGQVVLLGAADELHADGALPPTAHTTAHGRAGEDVDAAALLVLLLAKEAFLVRDEREQRQLVEALADVISMLIHDFRVHLVVGLHGSLQLRIFAPRGGVALRLVTLVEHALWEDVGGGEHAAHRLAGSHFHGSQHRRLAQHNGLCVKLTAGGGHAAVERIANLHVVAARRQPQRGQLRDDAMGEACL